MQLMELSAVVGLCYDGVKILLSPGIEGRGVNFFKDHFFVLQPNLNTKLNGARSN